VLNGFSNGAIRSPLAGIKGRLGRRSEALG
jgi:hypothetical protein